MLVKYFADIRELSGCNEERLDASPASLKALLEALFTRHGAPLERRVLEGGELSSTIIILINGRNVTHLAGLDSPLTSEDTVAIFPVVAGG